MPRVACQAWVNGRLPGQLRFLKLCGDGTIQVSGDLHVHGNIYDQYGSLSALRGHYNSHLHPVSSAELTGTPSPLD